MATPNGVVAGVDVIFSVNGVPVGCARTTTLTASRAQLSATCKESGGSEEIALGPLTWSLSTENIMKIGSARSWADFFGYLKNKTKIQVSFGTNQTGDQVFVGEVYAPNFTLDAPADDVASFSVDLQGTGDLILTTLASPY